MSHKIIKPTLKEFKAMARKGNVVPVSVDIMADQITPVSVLTAKWKANPYCFLLESVEGGEKLGRYSIVGFDPELLVEEKNGGTVCRDLRSRKNKFYPEPAFEVLKRFFADIKPVPMENFPRFYGGAVGYSSYETVYNFERLPKSNSDRLGWSQSAYVITGDMFIFDNTQQLLKIVVCARIKNKGDVTRAYKRAQKRLIANVNWLKKMKGSSTQQKSHSLSRSHSSFSSNMNKKKFMAAVQKAKTYISKGDIIQVVLSRRNEKKTKANPLDIYRALRVVNPSPYMYLLKYNDRAIIGSSPESLVRLEDGIAMTRPIAGTRKRGKSVDEDVVLENQLIRDPKEIAEHIMLVDLGRNDIGRVCRYGTVKVDKFMTVEKYSHVMHIVSEVTGKMKKKMNCFDLFKAVFPAGTLSGAPKIRAMEIIDELEEDQRGPYGGAVGYISYSGNMDMAITIRTLLWNKGHVSIQAGAGIVADSDPRKEFLETENKAAGMKETLQLAENGPLMWGRV